MAAVRLQPAATVALLRDILRADGCSQEEAAAVAHHLVDATLCGHDSHGVIRIVRYHEWLKNGTIHARTPLKVLTDAGPLLQLDGQSGMGQWLGREATLMGIERAQKSGTALITMRRAGHMGRLGAYAELACVAGVVSVQFANVAGSCLVAPFGAAERRISTAPIAIGVPNGGEDDFILDFATSLVAEGKALVAAKGGKPLPQSALVDEQGHLTADPYALYGESLKTPSPNPRVGAGALRTMGEHKGSGLALACELLAGALTGNGTNGTPTPFGNGWFALFLDPARLGNGAIAREIADYVAAVREAEPAVGIDRVRIPGDIERETRAERRAAGIPLSSEVVDAILSVAKELTLGVSCHDLLVNATASTVKG